MNLLRTGLLVLAATLPTRALAAPASEPAVVPADDAAAAVRLELSTEDADPAFAGPLRAAVVELLTARGRVVAEDAETLITVTVGLDAEDPGIYRTRVDGSAPGSEPFASVTEPCQRCGSAQLVAQLERQLDTALLHTDATRSAPAAAPSPEPAPAPSPRAPTVTSDPRVGPMGIAGIALLGTGFAATATGAGLWARGSLPHPDRPDWVLRTRPPGIAMVAGGAAAMITGGALIAVDLRRRRIPQHALAPLVAPGVAGMTLTGRF